jgi:hypothetical protein
MPWISGRQRSAKIAQVPSCFLVSEIGVP